MDLLQVLGIPEHISIEDACSMEHQVSDVTMNTIREFVNFSRYNNGAQNLLDEFKNNNPIIMPNPPEEREYLI